MDGQRLNLPGTAAHRRRRRQLNVGNLEQFDLITRSTKLNARHAKNLTSYQANDGRRQPQGTPRAADGSRSRSWIDSSAWRDGRRGDPLVGTEQGVGAAGRGMAASGGDITSTPAARWA
ncbi:hypothetical protein ACPA9J_17140 [Pseudomonas aeruginosa]